MTMAEPQLPIKEEDAQQIPLRDGKETQRNPCRFFGYKAFVLLLFLAAIFIPTGDYIWEELKSKGVGPVVKLDVGKIQGTIITVQDLFIVAYMGVPFAEAPIEDKRFEKTVPLKPWKGVRMALSAGYHCAPIRRDATDHTSEDCLYLNIFRPYQMSDDPAPIYFNVHGGAFELGNAGTFGMNAHRALKLLKRGVIIVSIQYRLGVFGFASDGSKEFAGNLGYWDQKEALSFIHRNAERLGGDPKRITISGVSAGSASVTALSISPHTRDFVHQVVAHSGSTFGAWAMSDDVIKNTHDLINVLGRKSNESVKDRLKRADEAEIYRAIEAIGTSHFGENFGTFIPRPDGDFFPADIPELIQQSPPKAMVIGITVEESLPWTILGLLNGTCVSTMVPFEERANFSARPLEALVRGYIATEAMFKDKAKEVQDKILRFYLKNNGTTEDNVFYLQRYTQLFSDLQFNMPVVYEMLERKARGWKIFGYLSSYINPKNIPSICPVKGRSYHGSDQFYADLNSFFNRETDRFMEHLYGDWIEAFTTRGSPSIPEIHWESTTDRLPLRFADLNPRPQMRDGLLIDRARFWVNLTHEYSDYDIVRMMPKKLRAIS